MGILIPEPVKLMTPFFTGGLGRALPLRKMTVTAWTPLLSVMIPVVVPFISPLTDDGGWSVMKQGRKSMIWYLLLPPLAG